MKYKYGDSVITQDGKTGIVTQVHEYTNQYFVALKNGGRLYDEDELIEWNG